VNKSVFVHQFEFLVWRSSPTQLVALKAPHKESNEGLPFRLAATVVHEVGIPTRVLSIAFRLG
jgi:hypothetical protein